MKFLVFVFFLQAVFPKTLEWELMKDDKISSTVVAKNLIWKVRQESVATQLLNVTCRDGREIAMFICEGTFPGFAPEFQGIVLIGQSPDNLFAVIVNKPINFRLNNQVQPYTKTNTYLALSPK